ncbi:hypothetical protein BGZ83_005949 [Gryganskiella cystojenkinii]|nr:hypothetical protein BGZ83_005949 [Gryganskiella cystojenkinii]
MMTASSSSSDRVLAPRPPSYQQHQQQHPAAVPTSTHLYQTSSGAVEPISQASQLGNLLMQPEHLLLSMHQQIQLQERHLHQYQQQQQHHQHHHQHHQHELELPYNPTSLQTLGSHLQDLELYPQYDPSNSYNGVPGATESTTSSTITLFGGHYTDSTSASFALVSGFMAPGSLEGGNGIVPSQSTSASTSTAFVADTRHRSPSSGPSPSPTLSCSSRSASASSSVMSSPASPNYDDASLSAASVSASSSGAVASTSTNMMAMSMMLVSVTACAACKRSHIKCDSGRPCQNCLKHPSKALTCRDATPKPRGRPKGGSKAAAEAISMARMYQQQQQQQQLQFQQQHVYQQQQQQQQHSFHPRHLHPHQQQQLQQPQPMFAHPPRSDLLSPNISIPTSQPQIKYTQQPLPDRQGPRPRVRSFPQTSKPTFAPRSLSSSALTSTLPPLAPPHLAPAMVLQQHHQQQRLSLTTTPPIGVGNEPFCRSSPSSPAAGSPWGQGRAIRSERRPSLPTWNHHPYAVVNSTPSSPSMMLPMSNSNGSTSLTPALEQVAPWSNSPYATGVFPSNPSMSSPSSSSSVSSLSMVVSSPAPVMIRSSSLKFQTMSQHQAQPVQYLPMTSISGPMITSVAAATNTTPVWNHPGSIHPLQEIENRRESLSNFDTDSTAVSSMSVTSRPWSHLHSPQQHQQRPDRSEGPFLTVAASVPSTELTTGSSSSHDNNNNIDDDDCSDPMEVDQAVVPSDYSIGLGLDLKLGLVDDCHHSNSSQTSGGENSFLGTGASTSQLLHFNESGQSPIVPDASLSEAEDETNEIGEVEIPSSPVIVLGTISAQDHDDKDAVSMVEEEERRVARMIQQQEFEMQAEHQEFQQRQQLHQQAQLQKQQALAQLQLKKQKLQQQL